MPVPDDIFSPEAIMSAVIRDRTATAAALNARGGWGQIGLPGDSTAGVADLSRKRLASALFAATQTDPTDERAVRLADLHVRACAAEYEMFGGEPATVEPDHVRAQVTVDGNWKGWRDVPLTLAEQESTGWTANLTVEQFQSI